MIQFTLLLFLFYHFLILQMRSQGTQRFSDLPEVIQLLSGISSEPNNSRFYAMLFSVFPLYSHYVYMKTIHEIIIIFLL